MAILNFQNIAFIYTPGLPYTDFTLYIKPPPIYVYTEPEIVGADDTADVIIKHRLEDGTLVDFPPEQTFELAVLEGCVNGNFMVGTDINVYFAEAQQPIKFVTADSLDEEFDKVLIRVGTDLGGGGGSNRPIGNIKGEEEKQLSEEQRELVGNTGYTRSELRAGFEKMIAEKKAEAEAEKREGNTPPFEVPIVTACALDDPIYLNYWQGGVGVEEVCEEPIEMCTTNESQETDTSSFNLLRSNQLWFWFDEFNDPKTANILDACNYINHDNDDTDTYGVTKFLYRIPGMEEDYIFFTDLIINVCLDASNEEEHKWNFNVENLRIPFISDYCFQPLLIDLTDGSNVSLLVANITNCETYYEVMDLLDWWILGPYSQLDDTIESYFVFSDGVRAHEYKHFLDYRTHMKNDIDTIAFREIRNIKRLENDFPCPEDAFDPDARVKIKSEILKGVVRGGRLKKILKTKSITTPKGNIYEVPTAELDADEYASELYQIIKERIYNWATLQSWYIDSESCEQ